MYETTLKRIVWVRRIRFWLYLYDLLSKVNPHSWVKFHISGNDISYNHISLSLKYREHLTALRGKVMTRTALNRRLAGTSWGASRPTPTLRTSTRVCTSGILCPGVVQKHPHSSRGCRPQCFPSHHNRLFAPYSGGVSLSRVPSRSSTTIFKCNMAAHNMSIAIGARLHINLSYIQNCK